MVYMSISRIGDIVGEKGSDGLGHEDGFIRQGLRSSIQDGN